MHVTDRQLLGRTRDGDAEAFASFYRAHRGDVLAFLRMRVSSTEVATDLMCETFTRALVAVHDRDRELPMVPIAWLITIARNTLVSSLRSGRVADEARQRLAMEPLQLDDADIAAIDEAAAEADLLAQLAAALPTDQLQAFVARVLEEREYGEIAAQLAISESVVRKRVSRAIAQLRKIREVAG